ncbi:type II toxin-antitoxin system Phd/YefM family antitoxin [Herbiconiux sp. UC225_62]|uniref:type II toxin-antitoxin system Phd/YefM family antitoxin n=1 Tax=Herbiconiux sp. UC225_62 TaxID=3350168 RepID=UPI0036D411C9
MSTLSVADARANFSKLIESAATTHERFEVTRNGSRAAVILSADDYDTLLETVDVLSDSATVEAIRQGLDDIGRGEVVDIGDMREAMRAAGRLRE